MNKYALALLAVCGVSLSAMAALKHDSRTIELRFVPANEAFAALREHLGEGGASAIASIDLRKNTLNLDEDHPQAAKARAFIAGFDVRPPQVFVQAVISRHVPATATQNAHDEVLARPTCVAREGDPVVFKVPSG